MKMKYWIICGMAEMQRKYGNRFRYSDVVKTLKYKRETVSEFVTDSREIGIVRTERDKNDLRNVWIVVNETELKTDINKAINMLELRIKELEDKKGKYQRFLNRLKG